MLTVAPITKVLFFAYFAVLIVVSLAAYYKRKKATDFQSEYYVAGRSFGPWIVAFVWATSWTSGGTFIGTPSVYYTYGWCTILWQAGAAVLGICGIRVLWVYTVFQLPAFHSPQWLYISYPVSWFVTLVVQTVFFLRVRQRFLNSSVETA